MLFLDKYFNISWNNFCKETVWIILGENMAKNVHNFDMSIVFLTQRVK